MWWFIDEQGRRLRTDSIVNWLIEGAVFCHPYMSNLQSSNHFSATVHKSYVRFSLTKHQQQKYGYFIKIFGVQMNKPPLVGVFTKAGTLSHNFDNGSFQLFSMLPKAFTRPCAI